MFSLFKRRLACLILSGLLIQMLQTIANHALFWSKKHLTWLILCSFLILRISFTWLIFHSIFELWNLEICSSIYFTCFVTAIDKIIAINIHQRWPTSMMTYINDDLHQRWTYINNDLHQRWPTSTMICNNNDLQQGWPATTSRRSEAFSRGLFFHWSWLFPNTSTSTLMTLQRHMQLSVH